MWLIEKCDVHVLIKDTEILNYSTCFYWEFIEGNFYGIKKCKFETLIVLSQEGNRANFKLNSCQEVPRLVETATWVEN